MIDVPFPQSTVNEPTMKDTDPTVAGERQASILGNLKNSLPTQYHPHKIALLTLDRLLLLLAFSVLLLPTTDTP